MSEVANYFAKVVLLELMSKFDVNTNMNLRDFLSTMAKGNSNTTNNSTANGASPATKNIGADEFFKSVDTNPFIYVGKDNQIQMSQQGQQSNGIRSDNGIQGMAPVVFQGAPNGFSATGMDQNGNMGDMSAMDGNSMQEQQQQDQQQISNIEREEHEIQRHNEDINSHNEDLNRESNNLESKNKELENTINDNKSKLNDIDEKYKNATLEEKQKLDSERQAIKENNQKVIQEKRANEDNIRSTQKQIASNNATIEANNKTLADKENSKKSFYQRNTERLFGKPKEASDDGSPKKSSYQRVTESIWGKPAEVDDSDSPRIGEPVHNEAHRIGEDSHEPHNTGAPAPHDANTPHLPGASASPHVSTTPHLPGASANRIPSGHSPQQSMFSGISKRIRKFGSRHGGNKTKKLQKG
jgi:hypothetical protein